LTSNDKENVSPTPIYNDQKVRFNIQEMHKALMEKLETNNLNCTGYEAFDLQIKLLTLEVLELIFTQLEYQTKY